MSRRWLVGLLALAAAASAAPPRDWSLVATRLPDGAFLQGNPKAPVQVVEYLSFTCPHCAVMEQAAVPALTAKYIRSGRVRYEVRHALRDGYDLVGVLLARCDGPRGFFRAAPAVYAAQADWMAKADAYAATAPANQPADQALPAMAAGSGLAALFTARGLAPARQRACLADTGERRRLTDQADAIWKRPGFPGTPDWVVNGREQSGIDGWPKLDAAVAAALVKRPATDGHSS